MSGFDVRFSYDSTKLKPSSLDTNEVIVTDPDKTTDATMTYFKFETEFKNNLQLIRVPYKETTIVDGNEVETIRDDVIRAATAFNPPVNPTEHMVNTPNGMTVQTTGGVKLGKMSFQMTADVFDISWFNLVQANTSPKSGIKVSVDETNKLEEQFRFIFTDKTASKDADLTNIKISHGTVDTENPDNSTYKEYPLTPTFDKDTLEYQIELREYIDDIDLEIKKSDEKSKVKIKVPKRDEETGELVYEADGTTIIYEEKDIEDSTPLNIVINELGKPDTELAITVTAEDRKNNKRI